MRKVILTFAALATAFAQDYNSTDEYYDGYNNGTDGNCQSWFNEPCFSDDEMYYYEGFGLADCHVNTTFNMCDSDWNLTWCEAEV